MQAREPKRTSSSHRSFYERRDYVDKIKQVISNTGDTALLQKAIDTEILGKLSPLVAQIGYFAASFNDRLTDYLLDTIHKTVPSCIVSYLTLIEVARVGNVRVFNQILDRWQVCLRSMNRFMLAQFMDSCKKSQIMLERVIDINLLRDLPRSEITTDVIKSMAVTGHIRATAYLVSLADLNGEQLGELLASDLTPTPRMHEESVSSEIDGLQPSPLLTPEIRLAIYENSKIETVVTSNILSKLNPVVRDELTQFFKRRSSMFDSLAIWTRDLSYF